MRIGMMEKNILKKIMGKNPHLLLQAMGAYGFLGIVKGKRRFLESIPYALKNINFILENKTKSSELLYLKKIFNELLKESVTGNEKA